MQRPPQSSKQQARGGRALRTETTARFLMLIPFRFCTMPTSFTHLLLLLSIFPSSFPPSSCPAHPTHPAMSHRHNLNSKEQGKCTLESSRSSKFIFHAPSHLFENLKALYTALSSLRASSAMQIFPYPLLAFILTLSPPLSKAILFQFHGLIGLNVMEPDAVNE